MPRTKPANKGIAVGPLIELDSPQLRTVLATVYEKFMNAFGNDDDTDSIVTHFVDDMINVLATTYTVYRMLETSDLTNQQAKKEQEKLLETINTLIDLTSQEKLSTGLIERLTPHQYHGPNFPDLRQLAAILRPYVALILTYRPADEAEPAKSQAAAYFVSESARVFNKYEIPVTVGATGGSLADNNSFLMQLCETAVPLIGLKYSQSSWAKAIRRCIDQGECDL